MTIHQLFVAGTALIAVAVYGWRINDMSWHTHIPRCVAAQTAGALVSCALIYLATGGADPVWLFPALIGVWLHLALTCEHWQDGPPPETESRPMPLDGLHQ
jgi:hypothetical protein